MFMTPENLAIVHRCHQQICDTYNLYLDEEIDSATFTQRVVDIDKILAPITRPILDEVKMMSNEDLSSLIEILPPGLYQADLSVILSDRLSVAQMP